MADAASCGQYWIVGCSGATRGRELIYSSLRERVVKGLCQEASVFDVPLTLKFGTFDDLIRAVDDLSKHDTYTETILRRIERQALDIDVGTEFKVIWQRNSMSLEQYLRRFSWDDSKYPRTRSLRENIELLLMTVSKLDDEVRTKTSSWQEVKSMAASYSKKDSTNLLQRDLTEVLTPDLVSRQEFVETEHLTTAVVVVPRGHEKEWVNHYETLESFVVPQSTRNFDVSDKEGNSLWKVVLFRSSLESFKQAAKSQRFMVREFNFCEKSYQTTVENRSKLEAEKTRQETFLSRICFAAFSDVFIAWIHLKAMRMFCEAVLRFGVPPSFCSFFVKPFLGSKEKKLRKELEEIFAPKGMFGKSISGGAVNDPLLSDLMQGDEFYPYVSLSLTLAAPKTAG
eukprot:GHVS01045175.1.p1 GENE.GHVS01045175.1~~GHVS01045175.1.p1  ORF type:complete len:398 (+),score=45.06 GHVS01045175.1:118-1311(+)